MSKRNSLRLPFISALIAIATSVISGCDGGGGSTEFLPESASGAVIQSDGAGLPSDTVLVGNAADGDMIRFSPNSGSASDFSSLSQFGSFADLVGSVDMANGLIISASDDNGINGINSETGEVLWGAPLGSWQDTFGRDLSPPVCVDNLCYGMGTGGELIAFDVTSRTTLWTTDLFPEADARLDIDPLLVTDERIFAGAKRFSTAFGDVTPRLFMVSRLTGEVEIELEYGLPSLAGDLLLIRGLIPGLTAYDFDTLQHVWSFESQITSTPAVADDVIAIHAQDITVDESQGQRVVGIDRRDGSLLWIREAGTMQSFFRPVSDGQRFYSHFATPCFPGPCTSGYPMALNPADGSVIWVNEDVDNKGPAPIVVNGQLIYDDIFSSNSLRGTASVNSADGSLEWISIEETFDSVTAIVDGKVIRSSRTPTFNSE